MKGVFRVRFWNGVTCDQGISKLLGVQTLGPACYSTASGGRTRSEWRNRPLFLVPSERRGRIMQLGPGGITRGAEATAVET